MKIRSLIAAVACGLLFCTGARAQEDKKDAVLEEARQHVAAAKVHYDLGEFKEAADEYIVVYRLRPIPALLFNIAQAYRQGGLYDKAKQFYKSYLRESPDAKNRATIEQSIREMDELLAKEKHTREAAPTGVKEPPEATLPLKSSTAKVEPARPASEPPRVAEAPRPIPPPPASRPAEAPVKVAEAPARVAEAPAPKPAAARPAAPPVIAMATPRPPAPTAATSTQHAPPVAEPDESFYTKWWFWTAVGVVAVGAGAAAMTMGGNAPPPSHFGTTGI